jgi:hypothetical protein
MVPDSLGIEDLENVLAYGNRAFRHESPLFSGNLMNS